MEFYILPHLPVENNFKGIVTGLENESLPQRALALSYLVKIPEHKTIDLIAHSGLIRCRETINACFEEPTFLEQEDTRLSPTDYGDYHGKKKSLIRDIRSNFIDSPFPNGESYVQMSKRISQFIDTMASSPYQRVLIIGHESTSAIFEHLINHIPLQLALINDDRSANKLIHEGATQEDIVSLPPVGPFII